MQVLPAWALFSASSHFLNQARQKGLPHSGKANASQVREKRDDIQLGSSIVPNGSPPVTGQPRVAQHMCCHFPCPQIWQLVVWCPAWAKPTLNPRRSQVQYNLQNTQVLWWYGMPYVTQAKLQGQWDANRNYQLQAPAKQPWPQLFPTQQTGR